MPQVNECSWSSNIIFSSVLSGVILSSLFFLNYLNLNFPFKLPFMKMDLII